MANPRTHFEFEYNLTVKKSELDNLRYGRRPDNTRAPYPIFNPWTSQSILQRVMNFYTQKGEHQQLLIPTAVHEDDETYHIIGKLQSAVALDERGEKQKFITYNDYHVENGRIQLKSCWWMLAPTTTLRLFPNHSHTHVVRESFNTLFKSIVTPENKWSYSDKLKTAWFKHSSMNVLEQIASHLETYGYRRDTDITISHEKETRQPIIVLKHVDIFRFNKPLNANVEQDRKVRP